MVPCSTALLCAWGRDTNSHMSKLDTATTSTTHPSNHTPSPLMCPSVLVHFQESKSSCDHPRHHLSSGTHIRPVITVLLYVCPVIIVQSCWGTCTVTSHHHTPQPSSSGGDTARCGARRPPWPPPLTGRHSPAPPGCSEGCPGRSTRGCRWGPAWHPAHPS